MLDGKGEISEISKPKIYERELAALEAIKKGEKEVCSPLYSDLFEWYDEEERGLLHKAIEDQTEENALVFFQYLFQKKLIKPSELEIGDGVNWDGDSALEKAIQMKYIGLIDYFLEQHPDLLYFIDKESKENPLHVACWLVRGDISYLSIVAHLINKGFNLDLADDSDKTPLNYLTTEQLLKLRLDYDWSKEKALLLEKEIFSRPNGELKWLAAKVVHQVIGDVLQSEKAVEIVVPTDVERCVLGAASTSKGGGRER